MSVYEVMMDRLSKYVGKPTLFKWRFNLSPMYRRSTGKVISVSDDMMHIRIKVPISWRNKNYVSSIFGGSMFSAVDPFPMVQLMQLLDKNYVVWDKSAEVLFKRPAREDLYAEFTYTPEEVAALKRRVAEEKEFTFEKVTNLTNKEGTTVFCEVHKQIYIADRAFYKEKLAKRSAENRA